MDKSAHYNNFIAGIDEAGRGPLAGPVVAATVILKPENQIIGLADSKKISEKKRIELFGLIKENAVAWSIGYSTPEEIDRMNIHNATLLAMQRAYVNMNFVARHIYVDGLHCPDVPASCTAIVKGDEKIQAISAASILAKVTRDLKMMDYHNALPQYGFNQHKGYPTKQHIEALQIHGPCKLHRMSYKPVKDALK